MQHSHKLVIIPDSLQLNKRQTHLFFSFHNLLIYANRQISSCLAIYVISFCEVAVLNRKSQNLLIPQAKLSAQQKQIYQLHCEGLSNKDIAARLDIEQRAVATQLFRIRKKAAALTHTYKIEPGAEHALKPELQGNTAGELKTKLQEDPGFFKLMFQRYATNEIAEDENMHRLASSGGESSLLFSSRAKMLSVLGNSKNRDKLVLKVGEKERKELKDYFLKQNIRPLEIHWDDGTGTYLVTERDIEKIKQLLHNP